jgi:hypothetical protein
MKLPWFNSIVTLLNEAGTKLVVPKLDAAGRFLVNVSSTAAPSVGSTPPTSPSDGDLWYNNDSDWRTLFCYDASTAQWLSATEVTIDFGHDNADGALLRPPVIATPGAGSGIEMPRDGIIQRSSINAAGGLATKQINLLINGSTVSSVNLVGGEFIVNSANLTFNEGDEIILSADSAGAAVTDISATLYIRWRYPA